MSRHGVRAGMGARRSVSILAVAAIGVGVTLLAASPPWLHLWWVLAPALAVAAVFLGIRRHRPSPARPWFVLLAALTMLWAGWTMAAASGAGLGSPATQAAVSSARNVLYLIAYPLLGVAALMMVRARTGRRDRDNEIDALVVMVALATAIGAWLWGTHELAHVTTDLDRLWVGTAPLLLAAVLSASVRMLFAAGQRLPAAWLMLGAGLVVLFGNLWTSHLMGLGLPVQVTGVDVLWVLGFVGIGSAALDPSMRRLTEPVPAHELLRGMPVDRLVLLGAALLAAPLAHLRLDTGTAASRAVVVGGVITVLLVMWRVARLLREREVAREALRAAADRDAAVAAIGRWAVGDHSAPDLLRDAADLIAATLPATPCGIRVGAEAIDAGEDVPVRYPVDDGLGAIAEVVARPDPERPETPGEREFLEGVAALLSSAVRRRAAEAQLRHEALHDPLTGLPNRALAIDRIDKLLARRGEAELTVVFIDLDGFKAVNDTFGHAVGDEVLCELAERLLDGVREGDTVARIAGDEFLVLLPDTPVPTVARLVERVSSATDVEIVRDGVTLTVSGSLGVAYDRGGATDTESLIQRADAAMYHAKTEGLDAAWADPSDPPDPVDPVPVRSGALS